MRQVEDIGKNQYNDFKLTIVSHDDNSFHDPLSKINLAIFRSKGLQKSSKNKDKLKTMKTDIDLFSRMYIIMYVNIGMGTKTSSLPIKTRVGPPAIAESNVLRMGNEEDLLEPLEVMCEKLGEMPSVDCYT